MPSSTQIGLFHEPQTTKVQFSVSPANKSCKSIILKLALVRPSNCCVIAYVALWQGSLETLTYANLQFLLNLLVCRADLGSAVPNARPRRGALLSSGVMTSSCSVKRPTTFLIKML